jgi:putative lipoic acid-binding regulatory protein
MQTIRPEDSLIQYPCDFPIKVMGRAVDAFLPAMAALVRGFDPEFDPATIEVRPSASGNYLGLTLTVRVHSREQLDDLYRALHGHELVSVVL